MVYLKEDEQRMLEGEQGPGVQKAMELLVKVADAYGAERMIDITQAYIGRFALPIVSEMVNGAKFKVPTSCTPLVLDPQRTQEFGLPETVIKEEQRLLSQRLEMYQRMGLIIPSYTCVPHFVYDLRKGEHVAFTETNVGILTNSWFGAMTNLEGTSTSMASAITGKTPEYGFHLPENRYGRVLIEVAPELEPETFDYADYVALATWTGTMLFDRIAVYSGLSRNMRPGHAKYLCASQIYRSGAGMFHVVGVTPEAPTLETACGGRKPEQRFVFGKKERESVYEEFCSATDTKVDTVIIGCPHCTLDEIWKIAQLLNGRKVSKGVRLWIGVGQNTEVLADRMGLVDIIEDAGGRVFADMCIRRPVLPPLGETLGVRVVATTSGSTAQNVYRRGKEGGTGTTAWFGSTKDCIDAAVKGKWRDK
ncbi:aconitase X [Chloroflexota bacterium]